MDTSPVKIPIQLLCGDISLPKYAYPGDAGMDLCAAKGVEITPFERVLIPCGIAISIPQGFAGFILPRSGLAIKHGLSLVNSPGLIDSNYRGELQIIAINLDSKQSITVRKNDRIAQLVIIKVDEISLLQCADLEKTVRGEEGFGSSGL